MPGVKKKDLYLSQSVGQLNKMADKMPTISNVKLCVISAQKLFKNAEENSLLGDEEKAYVLYMKFFNFISAIKKTADYKKNERYYRDLIGDKTLLKAMDEAEVLSNSLKNRYEEKEAEQISKMLSLNDAKVVKDKLEEKEEQPTKTEKMEDVESKDVESEKDVINPANELSRFISQKQLYSMLHDKDASLLVMDVRPVDQFNASHIRHTNCINVPGDIIPPGVTVNRIEDSLPEASLDLWRRRALMDFIVLVDWTGSDNDLKIKSTLNNLKDAIFKWDRTHIVKSEPLVLQGGYNDLLLFYPMLTTNAHVPRPESGIGQTCDLPSLDAIDYDLDLNFLKSPEELAKEREEANQQHNTIENLSDKFQNIQPSMPNIDRSKKPQLGLNTDNRNIYRPTNKDILKPDFRKINNLNTIRQELGDGQNSKPVKDTNIINQGMVAIPKPLIPSRDLKPISTGLDEEMGSSSSEPASSEASSASSSRNGSTVSLDHINLKEKMTPEASLSLKHDNERLVLEHKARLAKLIRLQELNSREKKETASLLSAKKQIQGEILELEELLAQREQRMAAEDEKWVDEQLRRQQLDNADTGQVGSTPMTKLGDIEKEGKEKEESESKIKEMEQFKHEKQQQDKEAQIRREIEEEVRREIEGKIKKEGLEKMKEKEEKIKKQLQEQVKREEKSRKELDDRAKKEQQKALSEQDKALQEKTLRAQQEQALKVQREQALKEQKEKALKVQREQALKEQQDKAQKEQQQRELKAQKEKERKAEELRVQHKQTIAAAKAKEAQKSNLVTPGLRVGWQKILDSKTGRYYYVDHNTKKTQWEPPELDATPQGSPARTHKIQLKDESDNFSGGLKRSHSSPNIAKMMADEEEQSKIMPLPRVDRSIKPKSRLEMPLKTEVSAAKVRNLQPIWGNMGSGLTGLKNLGNTCYLNSIIQCLSNTMPLTTYFLADLHRLDVNKENIFGRGGVVAEEYAVLIKALWCGQYKSVSPRDFKMTVGKFHELFAGYSQQDSQELLLFLMDGLHEDLNRVKRRKALPEQDNDDIPDEQAANTAWRLHKTCNESIIVELFQGQFKSTVRCLSCGKKSVTFDAFMYLTLPIPSSGARTSLQECFLHFSKEEKMTGESRWHCPRCKCPRDAVKQIIIWKLPHILLIHLKRFYSQGMWRQKITAPVDFPSEGLDMNRYVSGPDQRRTYSLYAVSNHYGSLDGGHYTAYCKNSSSKKWYKYDDHEVYDISNSDVQSSAAYILFYTCIDMAPILA